MAVESRDESAPRCAPSCAAIAESAASTPSSLPPQLDLQLALRLALQLAGGAPPFLTSLSNTIKINEKKSEYFCREKCFATKFVLSR